jgi:hypothetical protein
MYGIRNLTLAKLGVALMEIGMQKDISVPRPNLAENQVFNARKLLLEDAPGLRTLGQKYVKMVRKCIDCDFSCGDDLEGEELGSAIYTDVVCALEEMIGDWTRFFGVD